MAQGVLDTIDEDVTAGYDATVRDAPLSQRLAASQLIRGEAGREARYFSLNQAAIHRLQNLKTVNAGTKPASNSKGGPPSLNFEPSKFKVCSSSSSKNKNTTTTAPKICKRATLRFPETLAANECYLAQRYLESVPVTLRQRVLDVLEERMAAIETGAGPLLYGPLPYLRTLCQRAAAGSLIPPATAPEAPAVLNSVQK